MHDVDKFMTNKPPDIGEHCYVFEKLGKCSYGASCRFGSSHVTSEFVNVVREGLYDPDQPRETCNLISKELQEKLRKRKLSFERSERYLARLGAAKDVGVVSKGNRVGVVGKVNGEVGGENQDVGVVSKEDQEVSVVSKLDQEEIKEDAEGKENGEENKDTEVLIESGEENKSTETLAGSGEENKNTEVLEANVGDQPIASGAITDEGEVRLRPCEKAKV